MFSVFAGIHWDIPAEKNPANTSLTILHS